MPAHSTLLVFNSVERLFRGDFFHAVDESDVRAELAAFPPDWSVAGLGTTNWYRRNGELVIHGTVGAPRFYWADPIADPPGAIIDLDARAPAHPEGLTTPALGEDERLPHFPFAAVAVWDPAAPSHRWRADDGEDLAHAIATRAERENIGLAAVEVSGPLREVCYQAMCHIPLGGVGGDRSTHAHVEREHDDRWHAVGFYSANPTVRALIAHEAAAVHLHGRSDSSGRGGHFNEAVAGDGTHVQVAPLRDLSLRIRNLDVARQPERPLR